MYPITAEELHETVIEDLRSWCRHNNVEVRPNVFAEEHKRPLEQTIRMVINAAMDARFAEGCTICQASSG